MTPHQRVFGVVLLTATTSLWQVESARAAESDAERTQRAIALAAQIDAALQARWEAAKVTPAAQADDAEFLRRIYLDLTGTIPPVAEVRKFLADPATDKRQRLVERLLRGASSSAHFANVLRAAWLPDRNGAEFQQLGQQGSFDLWLRTRLAEKVSYDRLVRELLTVPVPAAGRGQPQAVMRFAPGGVTPVAFYLANDIKPETLAGSTSRLFLGIKLECAQCHNHPFATWSREQFWQYAVFFTDVQGQRRDLKIPNTDKVVQARFLDGAMPAWKTGVSPRVTLAEWLTAKENKFFAKAAVNRIWAYFFGLGLVEPVDDLHEGDSDELLEALARRFAEDGFDLRLLMQAIVLSRAYQRTSTLSDPSQQDTHLFARMAVRGLSPEQLFDSLVEATAYQEQSTIDQRRQATLPARFEFLRRFPNQPGSRTEAQTSILQALTLMNGQFVGAVTSLDRSETLAAIIDDPFLDSAGRIETLFLATLSRQPRTEERARLVKYVETGGPSGDPKRAYADVFWALLNSGEFLLNH